LEKFIYIQIVNSEDKSIAKTRELCEKLEREKNHGAERERERERERSPNKRDDKEFSIFYYKFSSLGFHSVQRRNKSTFIIEG